MSVTVVFDAFDFFFLYILSWCVLDVGTVIWSIYSLLNDRHSKSFVSVENRACDLSFRFSVEPN